MPGGRPTTYGLETVGIICERLVNGESLRSICRDNAMPALSTVFVWLASHDEFSEQYARARELQADTLADEIIEICDDGTNDWMEKRNNEGEVIGWQLNGEHVQRSRLRVDTRKWIASKLKPKKYGERLAVEANINRANDSLTDDELTHIAARGRAGTTEKASRKEKSGGVH